MRAAAGSDAELLAIARPVRVDLTYASDHDAEPAQVQYVSGWMFESFGLTPAAGRLLTEADDRTTKFTLYAQHGVRHLWFIQPLARTLEVYRLEAQGWFVVGTHAGAVKVRAEPFDAVEIDLGLLWTSLPEEPEDEEEVEGEGGS